MACKQDVKQSILNKVFEELTQGRYTFTRVSSDTVIINGKIDNNKTKASNKQQAWAIAREVVTRANQSFLGHVRGEITQATNYDPVMVKFSVNPHYVNHVYDNLPNDQKTDSSTILEKERDYISTNSGPNTYDQISLFDVAEATTGVFVKFIQFKQGQLIAYQQRLNNLQAAKKKSGLSVEQLTKLNNQERELKLLINGSPELGIDGLKDQIAQLKEGADINAVKDYVNKDLDRLANLSESNDIDDLKEAQKIIDFYTLAGTFRRNIENPFFSQDEIFLEDDNGDLTTEFKLFDDVMKQYKEWKDTAIAYQNRIDKRKEEVTVHVVNSDVSVRNLYGDGKFSFEDLMNTEGGLRDADWISMWTMDITQGIFSHNGVLPQVMFSYLSNSFEKRLAWARGVEERIDKLNPSVIKELTKLNQTLKSKGIVGIRGASYQLFKEVTKEGNETGGLVQRFNKEFYDAQSKALNTFSRILQESKLENDPAERSKMLNKAFSDLKMWRRANTIIMDITRLPEFSEHEDNSYKQSLINILGEKGYKEQVERQKTLLQKYEAERQSIIETAMHLETVDSFDALSDKAKSDIAYWENNHSPFKGIEDYNSVTGIFIGGSKANNFMSYNNFIPRKHAATTSVDSNNNYKFEDTTNDLGYYSEAYSTIENNDVLSEFYDVMKEVTETIRENLPYELQQKMAANSLPALKKTSVEMLADKNTGLLRSLWPAFKNLMEKVRLGFGVNKQSEVSYTTVDEATGQTNYKVNDSFLKGNTKAVSDRMTIEKIRFLQAINAGRRDEDKVKNISRFSTFTLKSLDVEALLLLSEYLHVDLSIDDIKAGRLDKIKNITGENVQIGKYIRDYSLHTVVQTQSFDLAKIAKYYSNITMAYAARQEALPVLEIIKKHYEQIKKPKTNNLDAPIYNQMNESYMMDGLRTNANKQMEDWFERVALGNYEAKHKGVHGFKTDMKKAADSKFMPRYYKDIYSEEEKKKIKEIDALLANEKDEKKAKELMDMKEAMGKARTGTALVDNLLGWIRTLRLGYNLSSATTNFMEGVTSNMVLASLNEYFNPNEIYYGYGVIKGSFVKNATFGLVETPAAKKNRSLMDKFNVIMDSRNELQKSSMKTYADKLSWLNPHTLNQRVEYVNQSPIMIAMLRSIKIKDKNGNEQSVWNSFEKDGKLKEDFRTEENIENWEELIGSDYLHFKQKLHKAIVLAHGNYDELRGMMIKSNSGGKAMMMFKTWLPMQLYGRFGVEQDDIQSGTKFKGRYRSYTATTAAIHGLTVGTAMYGPVGSIIGGSLGLAIGYFYGADTGVGALQQTLTATKTLAKKAIGMPVNMLAGRKLIGTGEADFEKWVGNGKFTKQDAKNMSANMADIAMQLTMIALGLMVKAALWDDDDDPDSARRRWHNGLINKIVQLSSQASMYVNPPALFKSMIQDNGLFAYLTEVGKEMVALKEFFEGDDIKSSGPHRGESGLKIQTNKLLMPGLFKDGNPLPYDFKEGEFKIPSLGFDTQAEKVFEETPFHDYFKSDKKKDQENNKSDRAERKLELEEVLDISDYEGDTPEDQQKAKDKEIRKILDKELPTPNKLKKMEMTREEYEENLAEESDNEE